MTTGKTTPLTSRTFAGQVKSLLFNMLSRLVITFLPRSKYLLISWLQSPSAVILEPKKLKSVIVSTVSPSICLLLKCLANVCFYQKQAGLVQRAQDQPWPSWENTNAEAVIAVF